VKTKPKIEIGTTYPHCWQNRYVNAEVVSRRKEGGRWLWTVRLTESQQPIRRAESQCIAEYEATTKSISAEIEYISSLPRFRACRATARRAGGTCVVQWIDFPLGGLWCEIREQITYNKGRNTHWTKSEYSDAESLLASGDAVRVS
jgi:hypothetical protein